MTFKNITLGLAFCSLAGFQSIPGLQAQPAEPPPPPQIRSFNEDHKDHVEHRDDGPEKSRAEHSEERVIESDGPKRKKEIRIERRGPNVQREVEIHEEEDVILEEREGAAPRIQKRVRRLEGRPRVYVEGPREERRILRVEPGEKDVIIRRGPRREMRFEGPPAHPLLAPRIREDVRRELRRSGEMSKETREHSEAQLEHLEAAIRHLRAAQAQLESELDRLRAGREGNRKEIRRRDADR